ncbi:MAG: hypothetical protein IJK78_09170 [Bacteroidales bacterium]|nr:hypothetical protein [Bacteroidales bacterium]
MKKVFLLFAMMMAFVTFASAQGTKISVSASEKQAMMDPVVEALQGLIAKFDGTYKPGTTIDEVFQISDFEILIKGKVNYKSTNCGDVRTDYKVKMIVEGSKTYAEPSIYTPYGAFGGLVITGYEWDNVGYKTQVKHYSSSLLKSR